MRWVDVMHMQEKEVQKTEELGMVSIFRTVEGNTCLKALNRKQQEERSV